MKTYQLPYIVYISTIFLATSVFNLEARAKKKVANEKQTTQKKSDADAEKLVSIDYNNADLSTIINQMAALKQVNILLPSTGIKEKVTFSLEKKVSIDEAWNLLQTILDIAEYTMTPKNNIYAITKNLKDIGREPLPIYFNTLYKDLPDSDEVIRYVHYLTNIKVTDDSSNEITTLLKEILPPTTSSFITDAVSNSLIIAARARDIKAIMTIISRLDQPGFEEKMEIIPLQFSQSDIIAELFNESILKVTQSFQPYNIKAPQKSDVSYFEKDTRIMADARTNSLIVVGRSQAVDRIKEFIHSHLDVPADSGKSILHVYELQYLNAEKFEPILTKIVQSAADSGTGQSRAGDVSGGTERYFEGVIIKADSFISTDKTSGGSNSIIGSNKLIIAARNDDWKRIKELIQKLDIPQRQVFIEILVADLTIDDQRALGSILRNPANIPLPGQMDFQSAQLNPGVIPDTFGTPPAQTVGYIDNNGNPVASDLMRNTLDAQGNKTDAGTLALTSLLPGGTTAISFSDNNGKTWNLLQLLKLFGHSKILTHPHVLAMHNQPALVEVGNTRFLTDAVSGNINPNIANKEIKASLAVNITPRISTSDMVNMQVNITINEFLPAAGNARTTREVNTNANITNGGVLAIGGLVQKNEQTSANETPVLSRIPIIGWFFKNKKKGITETNLTVFICPTVIEPSVRNGIAQYTRDYIQLSKDYSSDSGLFGDLRDPITHWFFTAAKTSDETDSNEQKVIDAFFAKNNSYDTQDVIQDDQYRAPKDKLSDAQKASQESHVTAGKPLETAYNNQADTQRLKEILKHEENPFIIHEEPVQVTT